MSRIGNRKLTIPAGVTVTVDGNLVTVKGPKGELQTNSVKGVNVKVEGTEVVVERESEIVLYYM